MLMAKHSPLIAGGVILEGDMAVRKITAIKRFYVKGRMVNIGETIDVKDGLASELISSNKAVNYVPIVIAQPIEIVDIEVDDGHVEEDDTDTVKPKRRYKNVR